MNRGLMGLLLVLASTAVAADCKQDCKDAYKACSQGASSLDDTMQCKKQYKDCASACDASGIAAAGLEAYDGPGRTCGPEVSGASIGLAGGRQSIPAR